MKDALQFYEHFISNSNRKIADHLCTNNEKC